MRDWSILAAIAFVLIVAWLFLKHDLRGIALGDEEDPATIVEPLLPGRAAFTIAQCLPGSVEPYGSPTPEEYSGTATVAVLSCRSISSSVAIVLGYVVLAVTSLVALRALARRK